MDEHQNSFQTNNVKRILLKMLKWASFYWGHYLTLAFITFFSALIPVANAEALRRLFNAVYEKSTDQLWSSAIFYLAIFLIGLFLEVGRNWLSQNLTNKSSLDLQLAVLRRLFMMNLLDFQKIHTGDKVQRVNESAVASQLGMNKQIPTFIEKALSVIFLFIYLTVISWEMLAGSMAIAIIVPILTTLMAKPIRRWQIEANQSQATQDVRLQEQMKAPEVVRMYHLQDSFLKKWKHQVQITNKYKTIIHLLQYASGLTVYIGYYLGVVYIFGIGAWLLNQGRIDIGAIAAFVIAYEQLLYPIHYLLNSWTTLQDSLAHAGRVFEMADPTDQTELLEGTNEIPMNGDLIFNNVTFQYSKEKAVLKNFTLVIEEGYTTALVGGSGGGKSTILKLAMGLYSPEKGEIRLGKTRIEKQNLGVLRKQIAYVSQDIELLDASVFDNIRVGRLDATLDEVIHAAKLARAHEFIEILPEKYNTILGEDGNRLSGGERQRISIARAYLRNPSILILDEPTSALDNLNEAAMQETLGKLMNGRTVLVVAHRLSTIRNADRIVVIEDGEIMEDGTHEHLLQLNGRYSTLCKK